MHPRHRSVVEHQTVGLAADLDHLVDRGTKRHLARTAYLDLVSHEHMTATTQPGYASNPVTPCHLIRQVRVSAPSTIDDRIRAAIAAAGASEPLRISDHLRSGRNQIFNVAGAGRSWIAKRTASPAEAWFATTIGPGVQWVAPSVAVEDPHLVITERIDECPTAHQLSATDPHAALDTLASLAGPLAELHAWPTGDDAPQSTAALPELDPIHIGALIDSTEPARELLRRLHRRDALRSAMRATYAAEGPAGLIHGDLKIDNVLCTPRTPTIIDWELCGIGPLAWDLGSVVGSMLAMWIDSADLTRSGPAAWLAAAAVPYAEVNAAARRFMGTYQDAYAERAPDPQTIAAAAATWLVARSWAESLQRLTIDPRLLLRLVVAEGAALRPTRLLGDRLPTARSHAAG